MAKKLSKEEVKGPDAFIAFSDRAIQWLENHKKSITTVLVAGVVFGAGVMGLEQWRNYTGSKLQAELYSIEAEANKKLEELEEKENYEFKNLDEDFGQVLNKYNDFIRKNPGTAAAYMAILDSVSLMQKYGEWERAKEMLTPATKKVKETEFFYGLVNMQMAAVTLNLQQYGEAITYLKKVLDSDKQSHFHAQSLLKLGISHQNLKEFDQAKKYYEQLENDYSDTEAARTAKSNLRYLYLKTDVGQNDTGEVEDKDDGENNEIKQ